MAVPQKRVVDTWKLKKWYTVVAPKFLNNAEAAEIPALDDASLMNRIIQLPLKEITRDISHSYTSIRLRVTEISGKRAYAKFIGHSIAREFLRTLTRRRRTPVDVVVSLVSKDEVEFKIKTMAVAAGKTSKSQRKAIRAAMRQFFIKKAQTMEFGEIVRAVLFNKMGFELLDLLRKIYPVARVEIWKTELKEVFDVEEVMDLEKTPDQVWMEKETKARAAPEQEPQPAESDEEPAQEKLPGEAVSQ